MEKEFWPKSVRLCKRQHACIHMLQRMLQEKEEAKERSPSIDRCEYFPDGLFVED